MQKSIHTLYILQLDNSVGKSAKIILCPLSKEQKKYRRVAMVHMTQSEPAFSAYVILNTSC